MLGTRYEIQPIAPVEEAMTRVSAGAVTFGLEVRRLTNEIISEFYQGRPEESAVEQTVAGKDPFDDHGLSIHVFDADSGVEYLRFDCFANFPHYHYVHADEGFQVLHEMDPTAFGDTFEWAIGRLRTRLPQMLGEAGRGDLGGRLDSAVVASALDSLDRLQAGAREKTRS